jgi:hypothetical protein
VRGRPANFERTGRLMMPVADDYDLVINQQLSDLLAAHNAAVRYDWTMQLLHRSVQRAAPAPEPEGAAVTSAVQRLSLKPTRSPPARQ